MATYTIYHNPRCSKSRQTLEILRDKEVEVEIIEYLKTPPTKAQLTSILKALKLSPQELMRKGEPEYKTAGLDNPALTTSQQVALMVEYPKVIERPIVVKGKQAVIGRPPEAVKDLM